MLLWWFYIRFELCVGEFRQKYWSEGKRFCVLDWYLIIQPSLAKTFTYLNLRLSISRNSIMSWVRLSYWRSCQPPMSVKRQIPFLFSSNVDIWRRNMQNLLLTEKMAHSAAIVLGSKQIHMYVHMKGAVRTGVRLIFVCLVLLLPKTQGGNS